MRNIVFYHGEDMDGWASAALVCQCKNIQEKNDLYPIDYNNDKLSFELINQIGLTKDDVVFILDLSFTEKTKDILDYIYSNAGELIWIDHHDSSIELCSRYNNLNNVNGVRSKEHSAALLTYHYLKDVYGFTVPISIPIMHISDWDTFSNKYIESKYMKYGIDADICYRNPLSHHWIDLFHSCIYTDVIRDGRIVYSYIQNDYNNYFDKYAYISLIPHTTIEVVVCNRKANSLLFGDAYYQYPAVVTFIYDGEKYNYSIYSNQNSNRPFNCKNLAERYGGGGHVGAAGFSSKDLLFKKVRSI